MKIKKQVQRLFASLLVCLMVISMVPSTITTYAGSLEEEMTEIKGTLAAYDYVMSKSSITIQTGDSYQLYVKENDQTITADAWGSSDSSVATVDNTGKVTGITAGSAIITAMVNGSTVECLVSVVKRSTASMVRYNVLILDASSSMKGTPLKREKAAAKRFCKTVLDSDGKNYLAIIALNAKSTVICSMTSKYKTLANAIDKTKCATGTNLNAGLKDAKKLLDSAKGGKNVMKNVILCSDGLPKRGTKSKSGRYTSKDHSKCYPYANAVYKTDVKIKNAGQFVYALGFFQNSTGNNLKFGKKLMKDLASKDKFYSVNKVQDIEKTMNKIAKQITGLTLNVSSAKVYLDDTLKLNVYLNGAATTAVWSSSDENIATVDDVGKVTARGIGTATITARVSDAKITCKVTIYDKPTTKLNKSSLSVYKDCSSTLKATISGINNSVTWKSSNTAIAKVSKTGKVTGVKKGTCTITAKANGVSAKCEVTVKSPTVKLSKTSIVLNPKDTAKLKATVHGKSSKVKWSSTKKSVATVSSAGKITAKKYGTCYIKATCNGVTTKCKVTVEKKHPPYSFYISYKKMASSLLGNKTVNETGGMVKYNDGGKITKAGIYIKKSGSEYYFIVAVKGENLTSVEVDYYQGLNGKMIYDHYNTRNQQRYMNHFYLSQDSNGVYSISGSYGSVRMNSVDKNGKYPTITGSGCNGKHFKKFDSLESLQNWMNKD